MGKLSLLLLEDMATDVDLIKTVLKRSGMDFHSVVAHNKDSFVKAIQENTFDAILADNALPQFSAIEALQIVNERNIIVPFILVTGAISEEFAVQMMKEGACDYILKDRLQRLPNAVLSSIQKFRLDADRKKYFDEVVANEALLKEASRLAHFGSWEADLLNNTERWSDEQYRILGYEPGEMVPSLDNFLTRVHPEDIQFVKQVMDETLKHFDHQKYDCRIIDKEGAIRHISAEMAVKRDESGKPLRINGFMRDVSDAKHAELKEKKISADLIQRNKDLEQFAYIISHNLRGPVANIVGVSNALLDGSLDEQENTEFMEALSVSVKKLDNIITDLNHILQVKHHVNENKERINFSQIVDDIKTSIGTFLDDKCIMISTDFSEVDEMSTLKSYMRSIFYNLISNSIKFRKPELVPVIEIKSHKDKDKIVLIFRDNGIGIDLEKKSNQIFGLYKRFHPDYAEGKGMGLFMVKTQVETLGGKISVQSKVNEGTEFKIEFELQNFAHLSKAMA
jgi:PAS domain S-box-containing protein